MPNTRPLLFLGIEGGATRTVALLATGARRIVARSELDAANLRLLNDAALQARFKAWAKLFPHPSAVAVGLAGVRVESDRERLRRAAAQVWPGIPFFAGNDLETALVAGENQSYRRRGKLPREFTARILVLSGTGSCIFGRSNACRGKKIGGWGHVLGDRGSAYDISRTALRSVIAALDREQTWGRLGQRILRSLQLNEPEQLIDWAQSASKKEMASLAVEVFAAWNERDRIAATTLSSAAMELAHDAVLCAAQLAGRKGPVHFVFAGSNLLKQPRFAKLVSRRIQQLRSTATVSLIEDDTVWGAVALAQKAFAEQTGNSHAGAGETVSAAHEQSPRAPDRFPATDAAGANRSTWMIPESARLSPTEERNPRSIRLDRLPIDRAIELMLSEESRVPRALLTQKASIARAINLVVRTFQRGGKLFYVGAGTSGRLGVLDASECPPTFRAPPELVQGIIAGGTEALWKSIEGAEDDPDAGARAITFRGVTGKDFVLGIAASGRTPFVWGALAEAKMRRATTALLCFNPYLKIAARLQPDVIIAPRIGPEVLTGSTRLKAGTATKLVLNLLTTVSMVRLGKVVSNLMVDVNPANAKLRDRAVRIFQALTAIDPATAEELLVRADWNIKAAWQKWQQKKR